MTKLGSRLLGVSPFRSKRARIRLQWFKAFDRHSRRLSGHVVTMTSQVVAMRVPGHVS